MLKDSVPGVERGGRRRADLAAGTFAMRQNTLGGGVTLDPEPPSQVCMRCPLLLLGMLLATSPASAEFAGDLTIGVGVGRVTGEVFTVGGNAPSSTGVGMLVVGFSLGGSSDSHAFLLRGRALVGGAFGGFLGPSVRWTLSDRVFLHTGVGAAGHVVIMGGSNKVENTAHGVALAIRIERAFDGVTFGLESSPLVIPVDSDRNTRLWEMAFTIGTYR